MHIQNLHIQNFKSIRDLNLSGFKRINLLIGRPNVGKSNILEALSMFSIPYLKYTSKKLTDLVRMETPTTLFFDGNIETAAKIETDKNYCLLNYERVKGLTINLNNHLLGLNEKLVFRKEYGLENIQNIPETGIKSYKFSEIKFKKINTPFLNPPFGNNLMGVLETLPELKDFFIRSFENYGLQLLFDRTTQSLRLLKTYRGQKEIFTLSYDAIADTLRRVIFFKTAVASNENSVLLFEEPEAHAFPPYITHITHEIIESKSNQFFIATHSPYILNDFLENAREELAIFMVDYQDGQTVVKGLKGQEIQEIYKYGLDIFFNYESFL